MTSNIKSIREAIGITQRQLAELFGQTPSNISHYENGKQCLPPDKARALIEYARRHGVDLSFDDIYQVKVGAGDTAPEPHKEAA